MTTDKTDYIAIQTDAVLIETLDWLRRVSLFFPVLQNPRFQFLSKSPRSVFLRFPFFSPFSRFAFVVYFGRLLKVCGLLWSTFCAFWLTKVYLGRPGGLLWSTFCFYYLFAVY